MRINQSKLCCVAILSILPACGANDPDFSEVATEAQGLATTPRSAATSSLDISPPLYTLAATGAQKADADETYVRAAQQFAAANSARYGLGANAADLQAVSVKRSLLGVHVILRGQVNGVAVAGSTFAVSFDLRTNRPYRVHNSLFSHRSVSASKSVKTQEEAYDIAWQRLGVTGDLLSSPVASLMYVPDGGTDGLLRLVYHVNLHVSAPRGAWQVDVDASSGAVVAIEETSLTLKAHQATPIPSAGGRFSDRKAAFERALALETEVAIASSAAKSVVNGTGKVFDPDPVTTTGNTSLTDSSPASAFDPAYQTVTLRDISLNSGTYTLEGPWVEIVNFGSPATAPSTTTTGNWTAKRGNNAFNDVMTYYHIDRTQRYLQSLGFTSIQAAPVQADSDGFSGADNSRFIPPNMLEFGHGDVDDNEDADVILHEYGHAITHGINSSWGGGDMRAMGEGFGDYLAASDNLASFSPSFDNEQVFTWDGLGGWGGRRVDRTNLVYDPGTTYLDHMSIPGGTSDELWSTPLFQALLALDAIGVPKDQVDTILLEAQYGFGSSATMRQMATAIVATAKLLYPMGPHAGILSTKFMEQDILLESDWNLLAGLVNVVW